ncbi:MAG: hypothetical protein ACREFU_06180 [Acetobacteraceae bacterium]
MREDREAFALADRLGVREGYIGEHATGQAPISIASSLAVG